MRSPFLTAVRRDLRGRSIAELDALARRCGVSRMVLWRLSRGEPIDPRLSTALRISRGLRVPIR